MDEGIVTNTANEAPSAAPVDSQSVETYDASTNTGAGEESSVEANREPSSDGESDNDLGGMRFEGDTGRYQLVEDANGKRSLKFVPDDNSANDETGNEPSEGETGEPDVGEETVSNIAEQAYEQMQQPVEKYSLEELTAAISAGNIDERRVPDEYRAQVASIKIQQAQAQYNAQVEAKKKQEQELLAQQQLSPEQQRAQQQQFLMNLEQEASMRAAHDAGLSNDELENISLMDDDDPRVINYKLAKQWHRDDIVRTLQNKYAEESAARQKRAEVYGGINEFVTEAKRTEPNFDAIDKFMVQRVNELPYKEASELIPIFDALNKGTITEPQAVKLRMYYERSRKEYYARKNKLSTTPKRAARPPVTERAGDGATVTKKYVPDYQALRNASQRERVQWMADFLKQNQK
jgi:hypothetical protein|nr:MAG TPA: hypothetical protein [Caudoviricetes sp.]